MKKILFIAVFIVVALPNSTLAQSPTLQQALEGVKDQVNELVTAKDAEKPDELTQRIETFKKVISLSVSEVKDLKIKLLALEKLEKEMTAWQKQIIENLNQALAYYEEQLEILDDNTEKIDLEKIKNIASDFKEWRDKNYLPVAVEINDFFLTEQEQKAIETAEKRALKIEKDILKLEKTKFKGTASLKELLKKAQGLIEEGKAINKEAQENFFNEYLTEFSNTSSSTSTPPQKDATTTAPALFILNDATSTTSTSSKDNASTTPPLPPSIKDLVEDSLVKIKEAYRVFIEMSNLVRKLLS